MFGHDAATHEQGHERWYERYGKERSCGHGESLGVGEWLEQPALLRLEREDRQERHSDDEETEEQRRPNLDRRIRDHFNPCLIRRSAFQPLVRVFDHDDRGVDHGTDGNGNAAEAHDVRAKPEHIHTDIRDQYAERQGNDRHERAANLRSAFF